MEQKVILDTLDKRIEKLARQVGDLMDEYQRLVKLGKIPDSKLD